MSMVISRAPIISVSMNTEGPHKRRSARLSQDSVAEHEHPTKRAKTESATGTVTASTRQHDDHNDKLGGRRRKKVYDEEVEGFTFTKGGRGKGGSSKRTVVQSQGQSDAAPMHSAAPAPTEAASTEQRDQEAASSEPVSKPTRTKTKRRLPTTPDNKTAENVIRRSKRVHGGVEEGATALQSQAPLPEPQSHAEIQGDVPTQKSPTAGEARPVTVEKKRKGTGLGVEGQKVMTISLPFADTPIIRRNREMRKNSGQGNRRSSAGMRGKRASSLIDEGRGHALPHSQVLESEFFKHISPELTEPRRMRCLLSWCGTRSLPSKPDAPTKNGTAAQQEFQALQAAHIIQEELSQDFASKGMLSDWFSRDESITAHSPLRPKSNPRNLANAAKAEELEHELKRLQKERAEWNTVTESATLAKPASPPSAHFTSEASPVRSAILDKTQQNIYQQVVAVAQDNITNFEQIQHRLRGFAADLEFAIDRFAQSVHALSTTQQVADRVAEKSLNEAASALTEREKHRSIHGKPVAQMDALRGLARVLNAHGKPGAHSVDRL